MTVDLHCHSCYSFLDGASRPEELVARAVELGYTALALTDHNGLYGSLEFAKAAAEAQLQAITGAEVTLEDNSHLTLLAASPEGYANLCRMLSTAHRESERTQPRLRYTVLAENARGLICLTGCPQGRIPQLLIAGLRPEAERFANELREWFGAAGVFLEVQQNLQYGDRARLRLLAELGERSGLPLVATNNTHYHVRSRWRLQDTLVAIREGLTLEEAHRYRRANSEYALKNPRTLRARFRRHPAALDNALLIAERCRGFDLCTDLGYSFPDFQRGGDLQDLSAPAALRKVCEEALAGKYGREPPHRQQEAWEWLERELRLVTLHGLDGFFLVYRDLLLMARQIASDLRGSGARGKFELPAGQGRGSAVSSIICYLIGLSPVDPIRARLFPGRFLNESLGGTIPDIDIDFPRDIRAALIERLHQHYGKDHVALVNIMPTYRYRSAVREVGKALALPEPELDRLARGGERSAEVAAELERQPEPATMQRHDPRWHCLRQIAAEIQGTPRHLSQHVGGVVISSRPLVELVPVENAAMAGRQLIQWDKDSCADAGFIKVDLLALGALGAVEQTLELMAANGKPVLDLSRIDYHDRRVWGRIGRGETVGAFQVESRGQISKIVHTQPQNLDELAIQIALVRPGPAVAGSMHQYVLRRLQQRQGRLREPICEHPLLNPVLSDTLGVMVFQDQVMEVCKAMAGFTDGQADQLRRAMSRKRSAENMEAFRELFMSGAAAKGVEPAVSESVFTQVLAFSGYGFPKSHAAAFAVLSYQTAYLLHYHPAEYLAAVINEAPMGFYSPDSLVKDAGRRGVRFLSPCVNRSGAGCTVQKREVRLGLRQVKGLGDTGADGILAERERGGPYQSVADFVRRTRLPDSTVEVLAQVNAFALFGENFRERIWEGGLLSGQRGHSFVQEGEEVAYQSALALPTEQDHVELAKPGRWERMAREYAHLGLSVNEHPLRLLRRLFPPGIVTLREAITTKKGSKVLVAGMVTVRQRPDSAKGILFLSLEDETGSINVVVSLEQFEAHRETYRLETLVLLRGELQRRGRERNLVTEEARPLKSVLPDTAKSGLGRREGEAVGEWQGPPSHSFH